jgi:hypothetical protein
MGDESRPRQGSRPRRTGPQLLLAAVQPGNLAALRHDVHSPRTLAPVADQLAAGLALSAPWTSAESFQGTVASWSWAEAQAVVLRAYLDEHGLVLQP